MTESNRNDVWHVSSLMQTNNEGFGKVLPEIDLFDIHNVAGLNFCGCRGWTADHGSPNRVFRADLGSDDLP